MEDIQDGIKVSIQDGVEEDPTVNPPTGRGISCIGKVFIAQQIGNLRITTIRDIYNPIGCPDCSITLILENVVT